MQVLWRMTGGLLVVFSVVVGMIRAQPEQAAPFGVLLAPPIGCAMPCFMGIRPGETYAEDAVARLEAHPWVTNVNHNMPGAIIHWNWAASSPRYLNRYRENEIMLDRQSHRVVAITLRLDAPTGAVWRALHTQTTPEGVPLHQFIHIDTQDCVKDPLHFWSLPTRRVYYTLSDSRTQTLYHARRTYVWTRRCG